MTTSKIGLSLLVAILVVFAANEVSGEEIECYQCTGNSTSDCQDVPNGLDTESCNGTCFTEYDKAQDEEWTRGCMEGECIDKEGEDNWKVCCKGEAKCNNDKTSPNSASLIGGATVPLFTSLLLAVIFSCRPELLG